MLSTVKKDKKRRSLVKKFQIKNLYAKVFQQDLLLKRFLEKRSSSTIDFLSSNSLKKRIVFAEQVLDNRFDKQKLAIDSFIYQKAFETVPRNSSKTRVKNRCIKSGRSRSVFKFCKLSRICLREQASKGKIPGVSKASW